MTPPGKAGSQPSRAFTATGPKDILIFMDGTGKDGRMKTGVTHNPTNVWRLYELAEATSATQNRLCLYIPGIGSERNALTVQRWLVQIYGKKIVDQVLQAWDYLANQYRPGDRICLFGYSRGAFAARKVASLLNRLELSHSGRRFLEKWMQCEKPLPWYSAPVSPEPIPVECIAVWDTVGAVYNSMFCLKQNLIGLPDTELPSNVKHALHALAFHENRMRFRVWFPGSHSDVGGGGNSFHLPNISLLWLLEELEACLDIHSGRTQYPDVRLLSPSNAYNESIWHFIDRYETRLDSNALQTNATVHISVKHIDETETWPRSAANPLLNVLKLAFLRLQLVSPSQLPSHLALDPASFVHNERNKLKESSQ